MREIPWTWLVAAGVGVLVVTVGASATLAPSIDRGATAADDTDGTRVTLVGIHGEGAGWQRGGSVQFLDGTTLEWEENGTDSVFEVERAPDGTVLAAFVDRGYAECGPYESPCARTGFRRIDPDPEPTVIEEFSFPVRSAKNSEVHAVEPLPGGGVAVVDMEYERLLVVENGSVAWQWNASSIYDAPEDPTETDWLHMNDVDYVGDDRFLVSVRNANQLVVVERPTGVVEIINEDRSEEGERRCKSGPQLEDYDGDGEIRCGDPSIIDHQHNPQWLGDGAVLVADSENDRVVELHRTDEGRWEPTWELYGAGGLAFDWPRDADRLPNGNTLITDTLNSRIVEVDGNGIVVWSVSTGAIPYEADRLGTNSSIPTYDNGVVGRSGDVPVVSTLVFLVHAAVPGLPYWFGELQLLGTGIGLGLAITGTIRGIRTRRRRQKTG